MKINKGVFVLMLSVVFLISCGKKEEKIAKLWKVQEMNIAGQAISGDAVANFSFDIRPDGSYLMKAMAEESGKWRISRNGDSLVTLNSMSERPAASLIKELTDEKLVLEGNSEGASIIMVFNATKK
ncbi:MAG: hypothetical protein SFY32_03410 [Bacteroidota bacterium]|nr:hypothetical protein [Bacteroidota bacterium]